MGLSRHDDGDQVDILVRGEKLRSDSIQKVDLWPCVSRLKNPGTPGELCVWRKNVATHGQVGSLYQAWYTHFLRVLRSYCNFQDTYLVRGCYYEFSDGYKIFCADWSAMAAASGRN